MTRIASFIRLIRAVLGFVLLFLAQIVLPSCVREEKEGETPEADEIEFKEEATVSVAAEHAPVMDFQKGLPFKDLTSYVERLKVPSDSHGTCMVICGQLQTISERQKTAARFNFTVTTNYNPTGEVATVVTAALSGYRDNRWHKLKDLDTEALRSHVTSDRISTLVEEMISAMGQEGWSCMNDSAEQVRTYLSRCVQNNMEYVEAYCKRTGGTANIRVKIDLIVNQQPGVVSSAPYPEPQIGVKVFVCVGKEEPVESFHRITFHRKRTITLKSKS